MRRQRLDCLPGKMPAAMKVHGGKTSHWSQSLELLVMVSEADVDRCEAHRAAGPPSNVEPIRRRIRNREQSVYATGRRMGRCLKSAEALGGSSCLDLEAIRTELLGLRLGRWLDSTLYMDFESSAGEITDTQATWW